MRNQNNASLKNTYDDRGTLQQCREGIECILANCKPDEPLSTDQNLVPIWLNWPRETGEQLFQRRWLNRRSSLELSCVSTRCSCLTRKRHTFWSRSQTESVRNLRTRAAVLEEVEHSLELLTLRHLARLFYGSRPLAKLVQYTVVRMFCRPPGTGSADD